ncbi:MAG TPA: hypothetical protein VI160_02690 [Gemmatimonadales bacterium]
MTRRPVRYAGALLAGALAFGIAGLHHPFLHGDGAAQLATIAATPHWRLIHWTLAFAFPLMLAGILGLVARHLETPGASLLRAGAMVALLGFGVWALNILFMAGAGSAMARSAAAGGPAAATAIAVYDLVHPFGLAAERLATFTMGVALWLLGRGIACGGVYGRWLAHTATATAVVEVAVAVVTNENAPDFLYVAQALIVAWLAVAALAMLAERPSAATPP